MLKFFKSYEPYFNLIYLVLAIGLCLPLISGGNGADSFTLIPWGNIPSYVLVIVCSLLIWVGALLSNSLFGSRDFHSISSGMPGIVFVLYSATICLGSHKPWAILASVILLFALSFQTIIFRQNDVRKECFNAAVCLGLASVLYFPVALLLITQMAGLARLRTFIWREYTASILGFILPWVWLLSIQWLFDVDLIQLFIIAQFDSSSNLLITSIAPWSVLLAWSLVSLIKSFTRSTNISRNTKTISLSFSATLAASLIVGQLIGAQTPLEILAIPMAMAMPFLVLDSTSGARAWFVVAIMATGVAMAFFLTSAL